MQADGTKVGGGGPMELYLVGIGSSGRGGAGCHGVGACLVLVYTRCPCLASSFLPCQVVDERIEEVPEAKSDED